MWPCCCCCRLSPKKGKSLQRKDLVKIRGVGGGRVRHLDIAKGALLVMGETYYIQLEKKKTRHEDILFPQCLFLKRFVFISKGALV